MCTLISVLTDHSAVLQILKNFFSNLVYYRKTWYCLVYGGRIWRDTCKLCGFGNFSFFVLPPLQSIFHCEAPIDVSYPIHLIQPWEKYMQSLFLMPSLSLSQHCFLCSMLFHDSHSASVLILQLVSRTVTELRTPCLPPSSSQLAEALYQCLRRVSALHCGSYLS